MIEIDRHWFSRTARFEAGPARMYLFQFLNGPVRRLV